MKKFLAVVLALCMIAALSVSAFAEEKAPEDYSGTLTIYSPHDSDPLLAGIAAFEAAYPNVKVEYVADGTSNLVAKIAAESAAPVADVLWGGGADRTGDHGFSDLVYLHLHTFLEAHDLLHRRRRFCVRAQDHVPRLVAFADPEHRRGQCRTQYFRAAHRHGKGQDRP